MTLETTLAALKAIKEKEQAEPKTRWSKTGWNPLVPSCYDCLNFDEGTEYGYYGTLLSCQPGCLKREEYYENENFPFNIAPRRCIVSGDFVPDLLTLFFKSSFSKDFDGSDKKMKATFEGFVWWLENIKAVGVRSWLLKVYELRC